MFEFYLKYGSTESIVDHYNADNPFYEDKEYEKSVFHLDEFQMIALSHGQKDQYVFENEEVFLAIQGYVFFRHDFMGISSQKLSPERVYNLIKSDKEYFKKIKGNFTVIFYNKANKQLKVVTDHFALFPTYYGKINDEIYVTSNLNHFKFFSLPVDTVVVLEQLLFGFPILKETIYRGVKMMPSGSLMEMKEEEHSIKNLARLSELVFKEDLHRFDLQDFLNILNFSVSQKASLADNHAIKLTGDLDSRVMLSAFNKKNISAKSYSFGQAGSLETKIPFAISKETGIDYKAFYLEDDYNNEFSKNAFDTIYFSDGTLGAEAVKYYYEAKVLSSESKFLFKGEMGKEFFLPLPMDNELMNDDYIRLIYNKEDFNLNQLFEEKGISSYVNQALVDNNMIIFYDKVQEKKKEVVGKKLGEEGFLFYIYDLLKLIFRRSYGNQYHSQRFHMHNIPVFFDIDVVQYLVRSQHNANYRDGLKADAWKQVKPYQLYAQIFQHNDADLNRVMVDQGFIPQNLLNIFKRPIVKNQIVKSKKAKEEVDPVLKKSASYFYKTLNDFELVNSKFFNQDAIKTYLEEYQADHYRKDINKVISLYTWLDVL
jgi:asparagine synthetase B (glutamine-hydrolysing)